MKAARIHQFGPPRVIVIDDVPCPSPGVGQVLIRVKSAGVGPWDALIREQKSVINQPLPLTLGSDLAGTIETTGPGVTAFKPGDDVYGATNLDFIGSYAEFALANADMISRKPKTLGFAEAASVPVVAVTAWQMLFDYAKATAGQTVLVHGAGGSVGVYAVQLAAQAGLHVIATASASDAEYVRRLGAEAVVDYKSGRFEEHVPQVDIVLDTVGGETRERSFKVIKPGGILVSIVDPTPGRGAPVEVKAVFFLVEVTSERLNSLTDLFDQGKLATRVGVVLPLQQARLAHEMLAGALHPAGKIVLNTAADEVRLTGDQS